MPMLQKELHYIRSQGELNQFKYSITRFVSRNILLLRSRQSSTFVAPKISVQDESKDNNNRPSVHSRIGNNRALPLPPLLDPVILEARGRHRRAKPRPNSAQRTAFQRKLYRNPFAIALATRPRSCSATYIRIPSFFTVTFQPGLDPESLELSFLPSELVNKRGINVRVLGTYDCVKYATVNSKHVTSRLRQYWPDKKTWPRWPNDMPDFTKKALADTVKQSLAWALKHPRAGLVAECKGAIDVASNYAKYFPNDAHDGKVHPVSTEPSAIIYLVPSSGTALELEAKYRDIKQQMANIVTAISKLENKRTEKLTQFYSLTVPSSLPQYELEKIFPTVWITRSNTNDGEKDMLDEESKLGLTKIAGKQLKPLPIYNLFDMLGYDGVEEITRNTPFKTAHCLVLKDHILNLRAHMTLYKLQGYMAISASLDP